MQIHEIAVKLGKIDASLDKMIDDVLHLSKIQGDEYDDLSDRLIDLREDIQVAQNEAMELANDAEDK
jgi:hypothetical protein